MRDPRIQKLAQNLVNYSVDMQPGENVLIEMIGSERDLLNAIIEEVSKGGGRPFVQLTDRTVQRAMLKNANKEQLELWAELDLERMKKWIVTSAFAQARTSTIWLTCPKRT